MLLERLSVLTLVGLGPGAEGIGYAVSGLLHQAGCNRIDSQQFGDLDGDDARGLSPIRGHSPDPKCAVIR